MKKRIGLGILFLTLLAGCRSEEECRQILLAKCVQCHPVKTSCDRLGESRKQWLATIEAMERMQVDISEKERDLLADCLSQQPWYLEEICR